MMRREFYLPENDIFHLDNMAYAWETIVENNMQWLLIHNFPVVEGYNFDQVTVALKIETGYPQMQLDMAYFYPNLSRLDGTAINALCQQDLDGKSFQRWSRHRTAVNPWRPSVDDVSTHLALVSYWFEEEFIKKPYA